MNDNQTHVVGEVPPLANGSDVIHRLMYLWATKRPAGKVNGFEIFSITTTGSDLSAIAEAGDRIIALEKFCQARVDDIEELRTALHIVREYPDFDEGGPIPSMIDDVLMGRKSPMIESYNKCQEMMDRIDMEGKE